MFFFTGHKDSVSSLGFSNDGQLLASGSFDGLIQIWDVSSGNVKGTLEGPGGGIEVKYVPLFDMTLSMLYFRSFDGDLYDSSVGQVASEGTLSIGWL